VNAPQDHTSASSGIDMEFIGARDPANDAGRTFGLKKKHGATMLDVILITAGIAFFLLSMAYAAACDRL
jgi:hypothetical protein